MRFPLIASILAIVFGILIDWLICRSIPRSTRKISVRKIYLCSAIITMLLLIVVYILPHRDADADILPIMWMLYTWTSIYISKAIYLIFYGFGAIPKLFHKKRLPIGIYVGLPLAILSFAAMWWGASAGRRNIMISEVTITDPKLPASFDGLTIAQFSDAHVGTWGTDTTFISKLVDEINALHPDIIVFTGDIVNRQTNEIDPFIDVFSRLKAPMGVFSIMGNHDYGDYTDWPSEAAHAADTQRLRDIQAAMGWRLLNNEHQFIHSEAGDSIAMIGVENWGEPPFKQYGDLRAAYPHDTCGKIHDSVFKILLTHNPVHWHKVVRETSDINLSLSGHTHAMQFMIGPLKTGLSPAATRYPEWGGHYTHTTPSGNTSNLYVNIGCGEVAIPARIGATPEITLITLKAK